MSNLPTTKHGDAPPPVTATPRPTQTPGEMLQQARSQRGVSIDELAHEANLPVLKLQALESDNYQEMTAPTFVKGYIRSCCRHLNLEANQVIAAYEQYAKHLVDTGVTEEPAPAPSQPLEKPIPEWSWAVLVGAVAVIIMAVFFLWGGSDEEETPPMAQAPAAEVPAQPEPEPAEPVEVTEPPAATAEPAVAVPSVDSVPQANAEEEAQAAAEQRAQLATELQAAVEEQPQTAGTDAFAEQPTVPVSVPSPVVTGNQPKDELEFYFSGDCWIEIYDGSGQRLHQGLSRTGDTLTVVGDAPFSIMLGNAWVTTLQHNGATVAIEPRQGRNTLRLTVGDEL
ncbi:helix-turn-helix domain-containing protein [Halioxenophilus aromaticivorans]|uniref:Cytoskeleton protein RodZ-like C-terminal domain-containing protein n=1 Tax=Halioxenophilus aromaticivorans TaxID=1306992 RepID=A0AAV3TZH1_9ALTE